MEQLRVWGAQLSVSLQEVLGNLIAYLPAVLVATALAIAGWLLARIMRNLTLKVIERLDWLFSRATARSSEDAEVLQQGAARALSAVVFWVVLLSFVAAAFRSLGGPVVDGWTEDFLAYLPVLVGAVVIILLGFLGGSLARNILEPAAASVGVAQSAVLGRLVQAAIIISGFVIGTGQLGIDVTFLVQITTVLVGATLAGLALALALGTREHLANLVGISYARKHYRIGERVRVGEFQGQIIEMSDGCLFLETEEGDVSIPGRYFTREPFVKLTDGGAT